MTTRNLCYRHHIQQFGKLANHDRHLAAEWRTVEAEACEICKEMAGEETMTEEEKSRILAKIEGLQQSRNYADEVESVRYTREIERLQALLDAAEGD